MRKVFLLFGGTVLAAALYFTVLKSDDEKYILNVKFKDAGGILKNYNVKIGQVAAGVVKDISLDADDNAVVRLEMDPGAWPIGEGATAKVRPVNLLGEKYIDLDPGDLRKPVESGSTIEPDKTATPVELDDALNILDPDTRGKMRIIINEAGLTMAGRGADFNQTLEDLPPALDQAKRVVSEADQENVRLKQLITQGDRVLAAVEPKADDLGDLVGSAGDALETAAQRREDLGRTIQTAPAALAQLKTTLGKLQATSVQLSPAADDLRKTAPSLATTLSRIPAFTEDAEATLEEATRVSPKLDKLGRRTTPTLKVLRPTLGRLSQFTTDLQPLLKTLDDDGGMKGLLGFINGWAGVTDTGDPVGKVFRLRPTLDSSALTSVLNRMPGAATAKDKPKKKIGGTGAKPQETAPEAPSAPSAAPSAPREPKVTDALPKLPLVEGLKPGVDKTLEDTKRTLDGLLGAGGQRPADPPKASGSDASKLLNYLLGS